MPRGLMQRCVICRKTKSDCPSLLFHRFPKDVARCKKWVDALKIPALKRVSLSKVNKSYLICSNHFQKDQYLGTERLLHSSIPVKDLTPDGSFVEEISDSEEIASYISTLEPSAKGAEDENTPFESAVDWNFGDFAPGCYYRPAAASEEVRVGPSFSQGSETKERNSPAFIGPDTPSTPNEYKVEPETIYVPYESIYCSDALPTSVNNEEINVTDNTIKSVGYDFTLKLVKKDGTVIRVPNERTFSPSKKPHVSSVLQKQRYLYSRKNKLKISRTNMFALSTYSKNPVVYSYFKEMFDLPPVEVMRQKKTAISFGDGFWTNYIFPFLQQKAISMNVNEKLCGVVFYIFQLQNTVAMKKDLPDGENQCSRNEEKSKLDTNSENSDINHVLVLIVKSFDKRWHYVLGFYLLGSRVRASYVKLILEECVIKLQNIKLKAKFLLSMYKPLDNDIKKLFGITPDEPYLKIRNEKIFYMCDPQTLVLDTLKAFSKDEVYTGNGLAKWKYVYKFLDRDSQQDISLGPKLSLVLETIDSKNSCVSHNKVASQVFSQAVASGINIYTTSKFFPKEATHTADFVFNLSKLINCFVLSRTVNSTQDKCIDFMRFLESLKASIFMCRVVSKNKGQSSESCNVDNHCFLTWQTNVNAVLQMLKELFNNYKISKINVQRLCHKCIDDIHKMREENEGQLMLTCDQFEKLMQKTIFKSLRLTSHLEDFEFFMSNS